MNEWLAHGCTEEEIEKHGFLVPKRTKEMWKIRKTNSNRIWKKRKEKQVDWKEDKTAQQEPSGS